jgi:hypothetical protein
MGLAYVSLGSHQCPASVVLDRCLFLIYIVGLLLQGGVRGLPRSNLLGSDGFVHHYLLAAAILHQSHPEGLLPL